MPHGCLQQPPETPWGWRFEPESAQVSIRGQLERFRLQIETGDTLAQPADQSWLVCRREHRVAAVVADVGLVAAHRATRPIDLRINLGQYCSLVGEVRDDAGGYLFVGGRKASLVLEGLEQQGKAEPGGTPLVGQEVMFVGRERPVLGEFIRVPVLLHRLGSYTEGGLASLTRVVEHFAQYRNSEHSGVW